MALPSSAPITLLAIQSEFSAANLVAAGVAAGLGTILGGVNINPDVSMLDFLGKSAATLYEFQTAGSYGPYTINKSSISGVLVGGGGRGGGFRIDYVDGEYCYGGGAGGGQVVSGTTNGTPGGSYTVVVGARGATSSIASNVHQAGSSSVSGTYGSTVTAVGGYNGGQGYRNLGVGVGGDGGDSGSGQPGSVAGSGGPDWFGGGGGGQGGPGSNGADAFGEPGAGVSVTVGSKTYTDLGQGGWGDGAQTRPTVNGTSYYGLGGYGSYGTVGSTVNGAIGEGGMVAFYF